MDIFLSVIVATFNRAEYLKKNLQGLDNQSLAHTLYEIIVVDNASTDNTREVVEYYRSGMENLRYVHEAKPGLNEARNTGFQQAKGVYIAYLDDDAVPHHNWAESIIEAFSSVNPQPGVVGGPTLPVWEVERPHWLTSKFEKALSMVYYGNEKKFLKGREFLVGANMVFLKTALIQIGGFTSGLDRIQNKLLSGGDTAAIEKIKRLGYTVYYDPDIAVDHYVSQNRLNREWFIQRYYWQGYSEALMWQMLDNPSSNLRIQKFLSILYIFVRNPGYITYLVRNIEQPKKFFSKCIAHARMGYLKGLLRCSKD